MKPSSGFRRTSRLLLALATLLLVATPLRAEDVLLIPDSTTDAIAAFDPNTGALIDAQFIADPGVVSGRDIFNRPLNAIASANGTILVSDQFSDLIAEFDFNGAFVRIFSLGGTVDTSTLDNVRGIALLPGGDVLICNGLGGIGEYSNSVPRLNAADGQIGAKFIFSRYGGIRGPFDALVLGDRILVSDEGSDFIARYTLDGKFDDLFAQGVDFPEQMNATPQGTILVAVLSGGYIAEYDANGTLIGQFDPGTLSGYRGVIQLGNGNILTTTTNGVYEVTRFGIVVEQEYAGDPRYIERVSLPPGSLLARKVTAWRAAHPDGAPAAATKTDASQKGGAR